MGACYNVLMPINGRTDLFDLEGRLTILEERDTPHVQMEAGATRTLSDLDQGSEIYCTAVGGCTITVPATLSAGITVRIRRATGAGAVTLAKGAGLTIESTGGDVNPTLQEGGAAVVGVMTFGSLISIDGALE